MSKNELVSYIHALTGKSYKDARAICKAAKWDAKTAFVIATLGEDNFERIIESVTNATKSIIDALISALEPAVESAINALKDLRECLTPDILAADEDDAQTLEPWTAETSADILNGNEINQIFIDEINDGGEI